MTIQETKEAIEALCSVEDCEKRREARGYCQKHYMRWRKHGDPHTVLNEPTTVENFWARVDKTPGHGPRGDCWPWTAGLGGAGYGDVGLGGRVEKAHRVAWYFTHGRWPEPMCLHSCDNPPCCNPAHLREGTAKDNNADAFERKRYAHGERGAGAKLTADLVRQILISHRNGEPSISLARRCGVSLGCIRSVLCGRTWKHIYVEFGPPQYEKDFGHKLTEADVLEIRAVAVPGTYSALARKYGVSQPTIAEAVKGLTWKHVAKAALAENGEQNEPG